MGLIVVMLVLCGAGGCDRFTKTEAETVMCEEKQDLGSDEQAEAKAGQGALQVRLETSMGEIVIELNAEAAPVTAENFVSYVKAGFYDGTLFHRVIKGFMIQGGGFGADMRQKRTGAAIVNEGANGLKNDRGTIAMARTNDPDSATSQFFINHSDNDFLNYGGSGKAGYAVFGKVVKGMEVVDAIAGVATGVRNGMSDVPVEPVVITSAKMVGRGDGV